MSSLSIGPTANYQCPDCQRARLFEQVGPSHDVEAVAAEEWACTVCGAALLVDPVLDESPRPEDTASAAVHLQAV